jgi:hypothetical protein
MAYKFSSDKAKRARKRSASKLWMSEAFKGAKGQLREELGAKEGEPIPREKLEAAAAGKRGEKTRKRAQLALTARKYAGK